jgi:hypothetical protein
MSANVSVREKKIEMIISEDVCVCVCVCVRERERRMYDRKRESKYIAKAQHGGVRGRSR